MLVGAVVAAPVLGRATPHFPFRPVPPSPVQLAIAAAQTPSMASVAVLLREKLDKDKALAAEKREAAKRAADKLAKTSGKAIAKAPATASAKKTSAKPSPKADAKKRVATKEKAKASAKKLLATKAVAKAGVGGYSPGACDSLAYRGTSYAQVRYYKQSTIYHDVGRRLWRVKPCPGSRKTIKKRFNTNPKQSWAELVAIIRELNP